MCVRLLLFLLVPILLILATSGQSQDKSPIVVGGDHDYFPFEYLDENGKPAGFNVEIALAVAETMGLELEFRLGPWGDVLRGFHAGKVDVLPMFRSEERTKDAEFAQPHAMLHHMIFSRRGDASIVDLAGLAGKEVIVQRDAFAHTHLESIDHGASLVFAETEPEAMRLLASGSHNCAIVTDVGGRNAIREFDLENLTSSSVPLLPVAYCFAVTGQNDQLLSRLNQGLRIIKEDGRYDRIYDRHLARLVPQEGTIPEIIIGSLWVLLPLILVAMLVLVLSLPYRSQGAHYQLAAGYVLAGSLWILITDTIIAWAFEDPQHVTWAQMGKGWVYVGGTGVIVWLLVRSHMRRRDQSLVTIEERNGRLEQLNRTLRMTSACGHSLVHADNKQDLLEAICRNIVQLGLYQMAWVDLPDAGHIHETVEEHDGKEDDLKKHWSEKLRVSQVDEPLREKNLETHDPADVSFTGPSRDIASRDSTGAAISLPLRLTNEHAYLCVFSESPQAFDDSEVLLLKELAEDLAYGLRHLETRSERDQTQTKLERTEDLLRQAQKMEAIGRLAGGVAHDFNNILTVITGYSSILLARIPAGDPLRDYVQEIDQAGASAASLTHELLAFSRKKVLQPEILNVNSIVERQVKMLKRLIGENIVLTTKLAPNLYSILFDPGKMEQIFLNLAVNARDAMPNGGNLTIETANVALDEDYCRNHPGCSPGRHIVISVADTGVGMDARTQASIFEPFFTTKEPGKGTGLGLSTVYGIVQQSSGNIWVYSEPGRGSVFKIYLPRAVAQEEEAEPSATRPSAPATGKPTILVVEDEESVRRFIQRILLQNGYNVLAAGSGPEAIDRCKEYPDTIDLVLSDFIMPGMHGGEVVRALTELRPNLKAVFMSGYANGEVLDQEIFLPSMAFIEKPIMPAQLLELLEKQLRSVEAE